MKTLLRANGKSPFLKGFFLFFSHILILLLIICLSLLLFRFVVEPSDYFRLLTNDSGETSVGGLATSVEGERPVIFFEDEWAKLTVDGWKRTEIPVFFGHSNALLRKGAGMSPNSCFCGEGNKIVLSAHVTSFFYELEDAKIGDLVTMDTVYGKYIYKVADMVIFNYQDNSLLLPYDEEQAEETLILYTCYPRKNGHLFKKERLALVCKKIEGKEWN